MRRRGFGQVTKQRSGRYRARYTVPGAVQDWVNAPATFDTKRAAELWLAKQQTLIAEGKINPEVVTITFGQYAERWLAERALKATTRHLYRGELDRHVLPRWSAERLTSITPAAVREWHATLLPTRPTERAHAYALLRTIMATAVRDDLVVANPCRVAGAGSTKRAKTIRPATLAELDAMVGEIEPQYRVLILLGAWCALRFGEATELRRGDIDLEAGVVRVRRGVTWMTGAPVVDTPKTSAGIRDVHIPPHLVPAVEQHLANHTASGDDALVFTGDDGGRLSPHRFRWQMRRAAAAAGRPDLTFHQLRHTGATLAAATGATTADLMSRLGHTTPTMAMRYQHTAADRDRVLAEALSTLVDGPKAPAHATHIA